MTIDTSGMKLLESLENVNPDGSLAKMLKVLLTSTTAWYSDRCKLTWKKKVSKSNVLLFQLQASVHGIKGKESGLWLTPTATDIGTRSKEAMEKRKKYRTSIGRTTVPPGNLAEQVQYGMPTVNMYPTPRANEPGRTTKGYGRALGELMEGKQQMFPTPRASAAMTEDMEMIAKRNKYNSKLEEKIAMEMYPTPTTRDWKDSMGTVPPSRKQKSKQTLGQRVAHNQMYPTPTTDSASERTKKYKQGGTPLPVAVQMEQKKPGGKLNPEFVEFLMGYPLNWTKIETTE